MANKPISVAMANAMIQQNISYMSGLGVNMANQTESVSFDGRTLQQWLTGVMPYADELRICLGVYPPGNPNAGRITTILWPYKNGQPATMPSVGAGAAALIEPFNEGQQHP
jgi:hypothetical protein